VTHTQVSDEERKFFAVGAIIRLLKLKAFFPNSYVTFVKIGFCENWLLSRTKLSTLFRFVLRNVAATVVIKREQFRL